VYGFTVTKVGPAKPLAAQVNSANWLDVQGVVLLVQTVSPLSPCCALLGLTMERKYSGSPFGGPVVLSISPVSTE
jgi:hypothetical protein